MRSLIKLLRKTGIFIIGSAILLAGIIMLVTPGPGLAAIIAGLLILSIEFDWAEKYLHQARKKLNETKDKFKDNRKKSD